MRTENPPPFNPLQLSNAVDSCATFSFSSFVGILAFSSLLASPMVHQASRSTPSSTRVEEDRWNSLFTYSSVGLHTTLHHTTPPHHTAPHHTTTPHRTSFSPWALLNLSIELQAIADYSERRGIAPSATHTELLRGSIHRLRDQRIQTQIRPLYKMLVSMHLLSLSLSVSICVAHN